jgi:hypothetical protein
MQAHATKGHQAGGMPQVQVYGQSTGNKESR